MVKILIILIIPALIVIGIFVYPYLVERRRKHLKNIPFAPLWQAIIENNLPIYLRLSPHERKRLKGHIQVFLTEKQFIGCAGLEITEEMKLTIAGVACLLLLNESGSYFSKLRSILLYPSTYRVQTTTALNDYVVQESIEARLGESWIRDQVVLSWQQIKQDTNHWNDGHNVILHEFTHQLDSEDGKTNGVPILPKNSDYSLWAKVMTKEYEQLCRETEQRVRTVIDAYGTKNPAEYFAVATETFFEKPQQLLDKHPELYRLLQGYYQLNPVQWI